MKTPIRFHMNKFYMLASVKGNHMQSTEDLYNYHIYFEDKEFMEIGSREELFSCCLNMILIRLKDMHDYSK